MTLPYLSLAKPDGPVTSAPHRDVNLSYSRGGFYFGNYTFRPAAAIGDYLTQAQSQAKSKVLRDADVQLNVPVAIDILLFGYNSGTDKVTVKGQPAQ